MMTTRPQTPPLVPAAAVTRRTSTRRRRGSGPSSSAPTTPRTSRRSGRTPPSSAGPEAFLGGVPLFLLAITVPGALLPHSAMVTRRAPRGAGGALLDLEARRRRRVLVRRGLVDLHGRARPRGAGGGRASAGGREGGDRAAGPRAGRRGAAKACSSREAQQGFARDEAVETASARLARGRCASAGERGTRDRAEGPRGGLGARRRLLERSKARPPWSPRVGSRAPARRPSGRSARAVAARAGGALSTPSRWWRRTCTLTGSSVDRAAGSSRSLV